MRQPLAGAWDALQQAYASLPTQSLQWCHAAAETLHRSSDVHLIHVGNEPITGIAPLVHQRIGSVSHLALVSQPMIYEPMDLLARDDESAEALVRAMVAVGRPILLQRLDGSSRVLRILRGGGIRDAMYRIRSQPGCPVVELDERRRDPMQCISSHRRQDMRRALRKARQFGVPAATIFRPTVYDLPPLMDQILEIEAASWKGRSGTALKHDASRCSFFRRYAQFMAQRGELAVAVLHLGSHPAAMQLAIESLGSLWLLKIGYDQRFACCSPGHILMSEVIVHSAQRGLKHIEFMGTIAPWTEAWTNQHRQCASVLVYPSTMRSMWALSERAAQAGWRRLWPERQSAGGPGAVSASASRSDQMP